MMRRIKCVNVDNSSEREENFNVVCLNLRHSTTVTAALHEHFKCDRLDGPNQFCSLVGQQHAEKHNFISLLQPVFL